MARAFAFRRPALLLRDLLMDRERPDLEALQAEKRPRAFVWKILPHAARTFSACIALLPSSIAEAVAVAYLYCRCLDSYEDLEPDPERIREHLDRFASRFSEGAKPTPAPRLTTASSRDDRDRAHVILVNRCHLVDAVFESLHPPMQEIVVDLVQKMAQGMAWSSQVFEEQDGVLVGGDQLSRYCGYVLGLPVIFTARMLRLHYHRRSDLNSEETQDALLTGELVQLANITRDIEKDLRRGVAYHSSLSADLGRFEDDDPQRPERIRQVREEFLLRALQLAPAYRRFVASLGFSRFSWGRASAVSMFLFTDRYYRSCAARVGRRPWPGPASGAAVLARSIPAAFSRRWADRMLRRSERYFLEFVQNSA